MVIAAFPDKESDTHKEQLNDPHRTAALSGSRLLDSLPEEAFDRAVRLATRITGTPVGLLSLVDGKRQFFKAQVGLKSPLSEDRETPLSHSFCQYVVTADEPLAVADAREHPMLRENLAVPDLEVIAYLGVPVHGPGGEALGSFCAIDDSPRAWTEADLAALSDLSAMLETEIALRQSLADRQLVLEELNHRVKNIFTIVSGIVRLSRRGEDKAEALATTIESRLQALAQAHELIVPVIVADEYAGSEISLQKLIATLLEPHLDREVERVTIDGPTLIIGPKAVTHLALTFHEMATNAAKYGAFAVGHGQLAVTWDCDDDYLKLLWREEGVTAPTEPKSIGFGTELVNICIERQLRGTLDTRFESGGLTSRVTVPLDKLRD